MIRKTIAVVLAVGMILGLTACGDTSDPGTSLSASASVSKTESKAETKDAETITSDRTIAVEEVNGTVTANNDAETFNPVKGEHLKSGMGVSTEAASDLTLLLDSDKHVYAKEETEFSLVAEGGDKSTKTRFVLKKGVLKSVLENKLESEEAFEVETPNAVMAVRGTTFTVTVTEYEGKYSTLVEVEEGRVEIQFEVDGQPQTDYAEPGRDKVITGKGLREASEARFEQKIVSRYSTYDQDPGNKADQYDDEYLYDEEGRIARMNHSASGMLLEYCDYVYNEQGLLSQQVYYQTSITSTKLDYSVEMDYDAAGNMIRKRRLDSDGNIKEEYEYIYDANGALLEKSCPTYALNDRYHNRVVYSYNPDGTVASEVEYTPEGEEFSRKTYTYDGQGRLTDYLDYTTILHHVEDHKYNYVYDAGNRLTGYTWAHNYLGETEDTATSMITVNSEYDEYGNEIKRTVNEKFGDLSKTTVYEYTYISLR